MLYFKYDVEKKRIFQGASRLKGRHFHIMDSKKRAQIIEEIAFMCEYDDEGIRINPFDYECPQDDEENYKSCAECIADKIINIIESDNGH